MRRPSSPARACARGGKVWSRGRVGLGDRQHPEHLQAAFAPLGLGDDARAFAKGGESVAPENGHMDEDVGLAAVRHDEAIALGGVEPFDPPGDFDQPDRAFVAVRYHAPSLPTASQIHRSIRPPLNASARTSSPPMNLLRVAIGTIRSAPAKTAEIRNASDSVPKIANRSALNIGNTRNLSVAVDREQKKSRRAAMGRRDHTTERSGAAA